MKEKVMKLFESHKNFILSVRRSNEDKFCHEVLEMDSDEFLSESFFTFWSLYAIGANIRQTLTKRLIRELNDLHWDYSDDPRLPGMPSEVSSAEVIDENDDETLLE